MHLVGSMEYPLNNLNRFEVVLASNSPRRKQLLEQLGMQFTTRVIGDIDESYPEDMPADEIAAFISSKKAAAYRETIGDNELVITADTVVVCGDKILGKPADGDDACRMLKMLSGGAHKVITGVTITTKDFMHTFDSVTEVFFDELTDAEIEYYVKEYKPMDKAGAYGIQEWIGCAGVNGIKGSYYNVMGLPVQKLYRELLKICVCGFVSLYFSETMNKLEDFFRRYKNPYVKFVIGGAALSMLIFLFPSLYGEGYETIELLLNGSSEAEWGAAMDNSFFYGHSRMLLVYLALVVLFKVFATTATNAGGGCGGIFAPSLFLGCTAGFIFSHLLNTMGVNVYLPENNFALFGMAGLMSGVMHAPLTGIFLIAELTGGYDLFLPLMITSAFSYLTIRVFQTHSIYSMRLAKKGELLTHHKDQSILTLMRTENVVEKDFKATTTDTELGRFTTVISDSHRNLFPVLNKDNRLVGIVQLDDVRHYMFRSELYHRYTMDKFMREPVARISVTDAMDVVMRKFDETRAWNLPVEDEDGRYLGFVSRSKIFNEYRKIMLDYSDE